MQTLWQKLLLCYYHICIPVSVELLGFSRPPLKFKNFLPKSASTSIPFTQPNFPLTKGKHSSALMPCWYLRSSSVYCQSWALCMWLCWKSTPFIQAWLLRGVGVHGATICRLLGPGLIKSMLTNVYLIFRSMSQVPSCLYNQILSVAALNLSGTRNPVSTSAMV